MDCPSMVLRNQGMPRPHSQNACLHAGSDSSTVGLERPFIQRFIFGSNLHSAAQAAEQQGSEHDYTSSIKGSCSLIAVHQLFAAALALPFMFATDKNDLPRPADANQVIQRACKL